MNSIATGIRPSSDIPARAVVTENANQVYRWGDLLVAPKPTDNMLGYLYLEMERQGLLPLMFYQGVPTLTWFLNEYSKITSLGCFKWDPEKNQAFIRGLGWINSMELMGGHKKAEVGMAFLRRTTPEDSHRYAQMMIEWGFEKLGLDAMHGSTPVKNVAAIRFMRRAGFNHVGPVDGYCSWQGELSACEISFMTRDRWAALRPFTVEKE